MGASEGSRGSAGEGGRVGDLAILAGRSVLGGYLAAHGAQKLFGSFGGRGLGPTASAFAGLGLRPGRLSAAAAAVSELGGGLLTATGAAHPLGPVAIAGTMAVASATHRANGPFAANRGFELPISNLAAALTLAAIGPGRISVDRMLGRRLPRGLVQVAVAGAAAGVALNLRMLLRSAATPAPGEAKPASA